MIFKYLKNTISVLCFLVLALLFLSLRQEPDMGMSATIIVALLGVAGSRAFSLSAWRLSLREWTFGRRVGASLLAAGGLVCSTWAIAAGMFQTHQVGLWVGDTPIFLAHTAEALSLQIWDAFQQLPIT